MALMGVAFQIAPGRARRKASRRRGSRAWIYALVVVHVNATASVVRIVLNLRDVSHQVGARVKQRQGTDTAVNRQRSILKPVLVVRRVEQLHREIGLPLIERISGFLGEHAVRLEVLI